MAIRQIRVTDISAVSNSRIPFRVDGELTYVDDKTPLGQGPWTPLDWFATREEAEAQADRYRTQIAEEVARVTRDRERYPAGGFGNPADEVEYCWECGMPVSRNDRVMDVMGAAHRSCVGA